MKIGIIGATGKAGELILNEALSRGLDVTAIVRNPQKLAPQIKYIHKDVFDLKKEDLSTYDVVVNAYGAMLDEHTEQNHINVGRILINALTNTKTRLIVVGGAGSLFLDKTHTKRVISTLPEFIHPIANGQLKNLLELLETKNLSWTFISPAINFDYDGVKTGKYQIGLDEVILNKDGLSYISYKDYAVALVDEILNPVHINKRFTVCSM